MAYPNFRPREFRCPHCGVIRYEDELVARLELLRVIVAKPISIVSGYRCPEHNAAVGGARSSQHMFGRAADIPRGTATISQARRAGFRGIGISGPYCVHVDVRPGAHAEWKY